jgi:hypothetical protein
VGPLNSKGGKVVMFVCGARNGSLLGLLHEFALSSSRTFSGNKQAVGLEL